ncbi:MAG TPA: hydrogenase expression/formation protein HypE [Verrucomicrobiae bacterium]|nr:hydrogenase expression/formation protein HypE [Verrucomicrobiae bacterium]
MKTLDPKVNLACPLPRSQYPAILMAHGGGGRLTHRLIEDLFGKAFCNPILDTRHDSAQFTVPSRRLAMTTDSYVVQPLFFPGGDIGSMAVYGTVNDIAMSGARPLYLSCGFIIQEGTLMETLKQVVLSMRNAAAACGVQIITGDTKVVETREKPELFINTSGIGVIESDLAIGPANVRPGDIVLLSGDVGRHGMAIMAAREGLQFDSMIESDSNAVHEPILKLIAAGLEIHCLRDLTRGGLAAALNEISESANVRISIEEKLIPVREDVHAACEMLGMDPLHVANEGRFIAFIPRQEAAKALHLLQQHPVSAGSTVIGEVSETLPPMVTLKSAIGTNRILDMPSGEQLPRIC